jgi:predicted small secreted protein
MALANLAPVHIWTLTVFLRTSLATAPGSAIADKPHLAKKAGERLLRGGSAPAVLMRNLSHDTHVFQWSFVTTSRGMQMLKSQSRTGTDRSQLAWLLALTALFFMVLGLSACNTMRGMGEDVEAAGGAMSDTAEDTEEDIEEEM